MTGSEAWPGPTWPVLQLACGLALIALCAATAWSDLTRRRIPNTYCGALAALAVPWWMGQGGWAGLSAFIIHLPLPLAIAVPLIVLFALRVLAGGDVKLLLAVLLWIPDRDIAVMLVATVLAGGVIGVALLLFGRFAPRLNQGGVPYGVAIVAATLLILLPAIRNAARLSLALL